MKISQPRKPLEAFGYVNPRKETSTSPATEPAGPMTAQDNPVAALTVTAPFQVGTPETQTAVYELDIPLGAIDVSPYQPRLVFEDQDLRDLAESIDDTGLINPVTVRRKPNGRYELISGERRFRAHQLLRRTTIRAKLRQLSDEAACLEALTDNEARENLCDYERGRSYNRILNQGLAKSHGDLCRKIGVPKATMSRCMSYFKLPAEVLAILDQYPKALGGTKAAEFASEFFLGHDSIVADAIKRIAEGGMSEEAALNWARAKVKQKSGQEVAAQTRPLMSNGKHLGDIKINGRKVIISCSRNVGPEEILTYLGAQKSKNG